MSKRPGAVELGVWSVHKEHDERRHKAMGRRRKKGDKIIDTPKCTR